MGDPILFTFTFTFNCHGIAISALHLGLNLGKTHISYCPGACQPKGGDTRLQVLGGRPCEQSRLGVRFDVARSGPGGCGVLNSRQNTREVENTDKHRGAGACQGQESAVEQVLLD